MLGEYIPSLHGGSEAAPFEDFDDALHEIDELTERWQQRLSVHNLALAKRWLKNEIRCLCLKMRFVEADTKEFVAVFERIPPVRGIEIDGWQHWHTRRINTFEGRRRKVDLYLREGGANRDDRLVLVDNVELIHLVQGVASPTTIRLQSANEFFNIGTGAVKEGSSASVVESGLAPTYWKVGVLHGIFGGVPPCDDKKRGERVESRPQIVDDVPNIPTPVDGDLLDYMKLVDFNGGLRIFIGDDAIRIASYEHPDLGIEIAEVFLGPVDLYPTREKAGKPRI